MSVHVFCFKTTFKCRAPLFALLMKRQSFKVICAQGTIWIRCKAKKHLVLNKLVQVLCLTNNLNDMFPKGKCQRFTYRFTMHTLMVCKRVSQGGKQTFCIHMFALFYCLMPNGQVMFYIMSLYVYDVFSSKKDLFVLFMFTYNFETCFG